MFYQPEVMMYLWMLPLFALVILPGLWLAVGVVYRFVERSRLADVSGFLDLDKSSAPREEPRERRQHVRIQINGSCAKIAEQEKCCGTGVENISSRGICLRGVPQKFNVTGRTDLHVVFRTRKRDFTLAVRPKWQHLEKGYYTVGAEITRTSSGWNKFVRDICQPNLAKAA